MKYTYKDLSTSEFSRRNQDFYELNGAEIGCISYLPKYFFPIPYSLFPVKCSLFPKSDKFLALFTHWDAPLNLEDKVEILLIKLSEVQQLQ